MVYRAACIARLQCAAKVATSLAFVTAELASLAQRRSLLRIRCLELTIEIDQKAHKKRRLEVRLAKAVAKAKAKGRPYPIECYLKVKTTTA